MHCLGGGRGRRGRMFVCWLWRVGEMVRTQLGVSVKVSVG